MPIKALFLAVIALLSVIFAALNWQMLSVAQNVNLLLGQVNVSVGLVLVICLIGVSLIFFLLARFSELKTVRLVKNRDKKIKHLQEKLEAKTTEQFASFENRLSEHFKHFTEQSDAEMQAQTKLLSENKQRFDERVVSLRNELLANIAASKDNLKHLLRDQDKQTTFEQNQLSQ